LTARTLPPAGTCILFGDGCGAVVVQAAAEGEACALRGHKMASDGGGMRHLNAPFHAASDSIKVGCRLHRSACA
jgi:3-oxoacyl-[acyl-carrier-protein] synthase III